MNEYFVIAGAVKLLPVTFRPRNKKGSLGRQDGETVSPDSTVSLPSDAGDEDTTVAVETTTKR